MEMCYFAPQYSQSVLSWWSVDVRCGGNEGGGVANTVSNTLQWRVETFKSATNFAMEEEKTGRMRKTGKHNVNFSIRNIACIGVE